MDAETKLGDPVAHLRQALAEDAFTLYCQPIGAVTRPMTFPLGEVLVRLHEEEKALRPPGEFLPVLEHYGMMPELDRWVVRQVLRRLASGCRIPRLCINLSPQTLADGSFPTFVADELLRAGVAGDFVLFEVEESDALALPDCTARFAATIGSLGCDVVIESFGRAANSASALQLPCVRFVKLHGSLTRQLVAGSLPGAEIEALLRAAGQAGVELIADSMEDLGAVGRLRAMQIGHVQGFGVYQPHPLDAFLEARTLEVA
jgi:EAL domain-containing protein (putative c-di-GMP-specific phosphodiesterase class I)